MIIIIVIDIIIIIVILLSSWDSSDGRETLISETRRAAALFTLFTCSLVDLSAEAKCAFVPVREAMDFPSPLRIGLFKQT